MRATRVGFDFDGVLYYNPARVIRPVIYFVKKYLLKKRVDRFYIPKNNLAKKIIKLLHKSSFKPNKGFDDFKALLNNPYYQIYIITARFDFIKDDITHILKQNKINSKKIKAVFQNTDNQQPHIFKETLVKKLKLDYFVEDNWDIVKHLKKTTSTKIVWIYNLVDWLFVNYQPRAKDLKEAIEYIVKESPIKNRNTLSGKR